MIRRLDDRPRSAPAPSKARKSVPADAPLRERMRARARELTRELSRTRPLRRDDVESLGGKLIADLALGDDLLGFAMVAVSNEFWRPQFAAPFRRLVSALSGGRWKWS